MKFLTIVKRELLSRVRTKGFLVFTFGIPLVGAGFIYMEYAIIRASQNVSSQVAVVDLSHHVYPALLQALGAKKSDSSGGKFETRMVDATPQTLAAVEGNLRAQVLEKKVDGYLVIPADVLRTRAADYHALNAAAVGVRQSLQDYLAQAVNRTTMATAGVDPGEIASIEGGFT
ncbi:MAG: ABC transporter permease, partial [Terriglobales bacterium]